MAFVQRGEEDAGTRAAIIGVSMTDLGIPGVGDATLIASGGSALVYEALGGTGDRLAVKVLRGVHGAEVNRRFDREQSAAERLQGHSNIIRVYQSGVTDAGEPYLVMPLIAGGSLNDELANQGPFSLQQATADIAVAASALEFAHQRGVLHRDIKPGNLLRADDGSVIVSDFGIARVVDAGITSATVGASTPLYAAPEILSDNAVSIRSEVYSLGATLYALLAGQPAFSRADNIWATINRIRTEQAPAIADVPAPVMRVIWQAMAKEAADRPPSATHFLDNLRTALTSPDDWAPPAQTVDVDPGLIEPEPAVSIEQEPTQAIEAVPRSSSPDVTAPPAPAFDRPAAAMGQAPKRSSTRSKAFAAIAVLCILGGLALIVGSQLLPRNQTTASADAPPIDNSLPADGADQTDDSTGDQTDGGDVTEEPNGGPGQDDGVSIDELPDSELVPNTFVRFAGDHFAALLPEGWSVSGRDIQESYGFRSTFVSADAYLNIDTTPKEQREQGLDIAQSARDIAAGISSASEVRTEEVEDLTMHSFTFRNSQGVDSIDIFFEVDGDGYAVVAGSAADPDTAFATARLVALSVRSNPDQP